MQLERSNGMIEQQYDQAIALSLQKRPALETVIKPFASVLLKRETAIDEIKASLPPLDLELAGSRRRSGVPMVADLTFSNLKPSLEEAYADLMPTLKLAFPNLETDLCAIEAVIERGDLDLAVLAKAYLENNAEAFRAAGKAGGLKEDSLGFAVNWALSTVLNAVRMKGAASADLSSWSLGYCPLCGAMPAISYLAKPQGPTTEFLQGGGGQKYLHCALCGCQWRFKRNRCPACDTEEKDNLRYYQESGETGERIDACRKCGHYLLGVDLREIAAPPSLDMAAVSMVHLDIFARKKGFHPMTLTPWNRID